jgi:hypothetical protein
MKDTPINYEIVKNHIRESKIKNLGKASIREIKRLINNIEKDTGEKFIRMEMGVPGLDPVPIGVAAEIEALKSGVAAIYPDIEGIPQLKKEITRFVKLFLDIDVEEYCCIPTVGSMQGGPGPHDSRQGYNSFHRSGIPGTQAAACCDGTKIRIL